MIRASSNGAKTTLIVVEAAVKKPTAAAPAIPARVAGRHSTAQNSANSRYQGLLTPLSAISSGATGSSTTARASTTRSAAERTCPALAWKMNSAHPVVTSAPLIAKAAAASRSGR
jgi:hypothetical protein